MKFLLEMENWEEDDKSCPHCDGYGYIHEPDGVRFCACLEERRNKERMQQAGIPYRYSKKTLDNFKGDVDSRRLALRQVRKFVKDFDVDQDRPGMFLYGAAGTGKTHLAIGALKELLKQGKTGLFYNMVSLIEDFRSQTAGTNDPGLTNRLERIFTVDVLVLDDLGAGKLSDFVLEKTYSVVNRRYESNKCLIVTSNLPMKPLEEQISYPVFSRVRGMCYVIHTGELDFRNPDIQTGNKK